MRFTLFWKIATSDMVKIATRASGISHMPSLRSPNEYAAPKTVKKKRSRT